MVSPHSRPYQRFLTKLKMAREQAGLTQVEVARKLRVPQQTVSRMEIGERRVDALEFMALADLYEKPLDYFRPEA